MKRISARFAALTLAGTFLSGTGGAHAMLLTADFTSAVSQPAQAIIQQALNFYNTTFNGSSLTGTITFGIDPNAVGGASATTSNYTMNYATVRQAIVNSQSASATDTSAIANLPATTATGRVRITQALAGNLGLQTDITSNFSTTAGCSSTLVLGCVRFGSGFLNGGGTNTPAAALLAVTEHEINEVLGTASSLATTNSNANPSVADLFRYTALNTPTFTTNPGPTSGQACPATTPTAYFSVTAGGSPIAYYNNCSNNGDYGDFIVNNPKLPQDFAGSATDPIAGQTATSPETQLLDAIGYNLTPARSTQTATTGTGTGPGTAT